MNKRLIQQEELLQIVLNNIPSFVFWKDTDSTYQGCNLNFAVSAGLTSPEEIIGKSDYDLPWSKKESDYFRQIDKEVMESGDAKINFEEPQTISGGETRWIRTSKIPLKNNDGKIIGILGSYEDITERKKLEMELYSSNEHLKTLNSKLEMINIDLEQFAYATSHDLKEPIRMIGGFAGLLKKKYSSILDKNGNEYIDFIREGTVRMSSLVSQILTYSKIEKIEDQFVETNLTDIVNEAQTELSLLLKERNATINVNLPNQTIKCQPHRIKMLFYNLIINGIKFNNSAAPLIEINHKDGGDEWIFCVSDNGIGIEEEYQRLVFKPFKRLNTRNVFPGNGLGLSICKRIINLHGGEINFKKNQPQGTSFYFTILKNITPTN